MREKPSFGKKDSQKDTSLGCIPLLLITVIGYIIFSAINRVLSGYENKLDQFICYGTLICLVIVFLLADRDKKQEKQKYHEAQQEWKHTCKSEEVAIVSRPSSAG